MVGRDPFNDYLDSLTAAMAAARAHPKRRVPVYADDALDALLAELAAAVNDAAQGCSQRLRGDGDSE
jgi:hypothetical protein